MSKQRPSVRPGEGHPRLAPRGRSRSVWRQRVFKNTYTRDGQLKSVKSWSVKIQYQGRRRAFSLRGRNREAAAAEAQAIYRVLVRKGWEGLSRAYSISESRRGAPARVARGEPWPKTDARYWRLRLLHRKQPPPFFDGPAAPWSVRIEQDGSSNYFPLGPSDEKAAAAQAAEIYRTSLRGGWEEACRRYPREVTLGFHWAADPLAWTYTTLRTEVEGAAAATRRGTGRPPFRIALVEGERGLRGSLARHLGLVASVVGFDSGEDALREIPRQRVHFVLVNQVLPDQAGTQFARALETCAARLAVVVYSVYEDSSQLFMSTPGGASAYFLKRTSPDRLLAPIEKLLAEGPLSHEHISEHVRHYFYGAALSLQSGEHHHEMGLLTPREKEILDCLSKGYVDKEIADALRISPWTVHGHIKNVFGKLDVHSRTAAVVKYLHK